MFRILGSRRCAAIGIEEPVIQIFARWGSNTVRRYIREAPLQQLTTMYRYKSQKSAVPIPSGFEGNHESELHKTIDEDRLRTWLGRIKGLIEQVNTRISKQELELFNLSSATAKLVSPYIYNPQKEVYHFCVFPISSPPSGWKTRCGWPFAQLPHERVEKLPEDVNPLQVCDRCLHKERLEIIEKQSLLEQSDFSSHSSTSE